MMSTKVNLFLRTLSGIYFCMCMFALDSFAQPEPSYNLKSEADADVVTPPPFPDIYWEPGAEMNGYEISPDRWIGTMRFIYLSESDDHDSVLRGYLYFENEKKFGATFYGELNVPAIVEDLYVSKVVGIESFYRNGATVLRLPETIRYIDNTIEECRLLREVYLNDNLESLTGIRKCPNLKVCPLPQSLKNVGDETMSEIMIEDILFPPLLASVGNNSFCYDVNVKSIDLGNVEVIGQNSFRVLPLVKTLSLPESLMSIGKGSFSYFYSLETLTLPSHSISGIDECFNACLHLKELIINATEPYSFPKCFGGFEFDSEKKVYVPDESLNVFKKADHWKNLTILPMSELDKNGVEETRKSPEWNVRTAKGALIVDNASDRQVDIHNLAGVRVKTVSRHSNAEISVAPGIYIVSCDGESLKVIVE